MDASLTIPRRELRLRASRSGGPGGQHVNTSSTRVELEWDVAASPTLSEKQRARILARLRNRISDAGVLRLTEEGSRSQHRNRETVVERFAELVRDALRQRKKRRPTRPTAGSRERRLRAKRRRATVKKDRGPVRPDE
ncbi:MAG: alternative ribosome rescue aminoacyl-tRNA hydrolase ArfB [Longimicrobiaceae bacterium]